MSSLTQMDLFSGVGGSLYAGLILGKHPICAVENDPFCAAVLRERKADGWWPQCDIHETDIKEFDPSDYAGAVDCITAGFPCQDISVAGHGRGAEGERSGLWREVLRIAGVVRPKYLFLENSPAIITRGLGTILGELSLMGYDSQWCTVSAAAVGAPHLRLRWWMLGRLARSDSDSNRRDRKDLSVVKGQRHIGDGGLCCIASDTAGKRQPEDIFRKEPLGRTQHCRSDSDAMRIGLEIMHSTSNKDQWTPVTGDAQEGHRGAWSTEPGLVRMVHGVPNRGHRVKGLGNSQVPLQAALAWRLLGGPIIHSNT